MTNSPRDHEKPARYGNAFPWAGILAGVGRMLYYTFLLACLLVVVGIIVLGGLALLSDNEPVGDYF